MVKAIIFDMDGTVLDSMGKSVRNRTKYLKSLGIDLTAAELVELETIGWDETSNWINKIRNTNFSKKAFFDGVLETHYNGYRESYKLIPGFLEFLDYLDDKNIKYAIATATRLYGAEDVFRRLNIIDRFEFIITEGRVGQTKDHPDIYHEAAKLMGSDTSNTIVFEDALYAVKTAKEAGYKTIAVKETVYKADEEEITKISDYIIEDFNELLNRINQGEIKI